MSEHVIIRREVAEQARKAAELALELWTDKREAQDLIDALDQALGAPEEAKA